MRHHRAKALCFVRVGFQPRLPACQALSSAPALARLVGELTTHGTPLNADSSLPVFPPLSPVQRHRALNLRPQKVRANSKSPLQSSFPLAPSKNMWPEGKNTDRFAVEIKGKRIKEKSVKKAGITLARRHTLQHNTKPEATEVSRRGVVDATRGQQSVGNEAIPRRPAQHTSVLVSIVPILAPLPDIAPHIVQAIFVCRKRPGR